MIGELIGKGNTAEIFDIGKNKVVKLFKNGYPADSVKYEFKNSKLINKLDINTIRSYEIIEHEGRYGIVYDKIYGVSMLDILMKTQDLEKYAKDLAILHKIILSQEVEQAISLKSILNENIQNTDKLSTNRKLKLSMTLDELPEGNGLCHGDFHFGNIIVNQEINYIIDYMNICRGHKYGDIARTVYLLEMTPVPPKSHNKEHILRMKKEITSIYLKYMGVSREVLVDWLVIIVAARLAELSNTQTDEINSILEYLSRCE